MKNLIFFDVDGTLITKCNNEFIIPQSTTDALALLQMLMVIYVDVAHI